MLAATAGYSAVTKNSGIRDSGTILGDVLRDWRRHRGLSQMALALDCGISARHLSFIETGRSRPSREVALRLSNGLNLSPHVRDRLLRAAGLAPEMPQPVLNVPAQTVMAQTSFGQAGAGQTGIVQTGVGGAMSAIEGLLAASEPFPALAVDRAWTLVARNDALSAVIGGVDADLLRPPVNVLRLYLHPRGLASRIVNLAQWRAYLLDRLAGQIEHDDELLPILNEIRGYGDSQHGGSGGATVPLVLQVDGVARNLRFLNATTVFGGPGIAGVEPFAMTSFLPTDPYTRAYLTRFASRLDAWPGRWSAPPGSCGRTAPWPGPG